MTPRERLLSSLAGEPVSEPAYAVYDWFVENRAQDWNRFFSLGLGRINHATVTKLRQPHLQVGETRSDAGSGRVRRETVWTTDIGELREVRVGEWRQEYFVQQPSDYRILARTFSDVEVIPAPGEFDRSEAALGDGGVTLAVPSLRRTPFQSIQIDYAGLERFSFDLAAEEPDLFALIEVMNELFLREIAHIGRMSVEHVKLWENLSLETMGPVLYRKHLVPLYRRLSGLLGAGQKLSFHYDGKLRQVAPDIAALPIYGIDSFTPPPEGDMDTAEARAAWPDKYLWLHPRLGWYTEDERSLVSHISAMVRDAGDSRFCLMVSEDIPHEPDRTIPLVLEALSG
jgi:hypothetical protein